MNLKIVFAAFAVFALALVSANSQSDNFIQPIDPIQSQPIDPIRSIGVNPAPIDSNVGRPTDPPSTTPAPIDSNVGRPTDPPSTTPAPIDSNIRPVNPDLYIGIAPIAPVEPIVQPMPIDPIIVVVNPVPIRLPTPIVDPVQPEPVRPTPISPAPIEPTPHQPTNPAPIEGGSSGGGSGDGNNGSGGRGRRNNGGNDDEGGRKRSDSNLSLEELSTNIPGNDNEESGWSTITGAVIGVLGKKGALGIGILMVVLGSAGMVVYNRERFGLVKKA